jgi:hypothetical protein
MVVSISIMPAGHRRFLHYFVSNFITLKKVIAVPHTALVVTSVVLLHRFFFFFISNLFPTSYLLENFQETHFGVEK